MIATSELSNVHFMECIYIGVFFMSLNSIYIYSGYIIRLIKKTPLEMKQI